MTPITSSILHKSVIVAAHPDDEILWFSSILANVDKLILCFLEVPGKPSWSEGRTRSLAQYPLPNLARLDLSEADIFWGMNWDMPVEKEYGLAVTNAEVSDALYKNNFAMLKTQLATRLEGFSNVITHNPWGEYGNAEHVQVFQAVRAVQQKLGFNLWVTSYFSNKSTPLMLESMRVVNDECVTLPTNTELAKGITDLYKKHGCWTWYDDYRWPNNESFFLTTEAVTDHFHHGLVRPLQFIHVDTTQRVKSKPATSRRLRRAARRLINKIRRI